MPYIFKIVTLPVQLSVQLRSTASMAAYNERLYCMDLNWRARVPTITRPFLLNSRLRLTTALCPQTVRCFAFSRLWTSSSSSSRKIHAFLVVSVWNFSCPTAIHSITQAIQTAFPIRRLTAQRSTLTHSVYYTYTCL